MSRMRFTAADRLWLSFGAFAGLALTLGLPLMIIVLWSFSDGWFPPDLVPGRFTGRHWAVFLADRTLASALGNSLMISAIVTTATVIIAMPTAWALARFDFRLRRQVELFVLAPLIVPGIVVAVGLGRVFMRLDLAYTLTGVVLVQIAGVLPMTIRILSGAFEGIPGDLIHAARTLGAGRVGIVRHVILPLALPAMLAAGLLAFVGSFEDFERTFIVGAPFIHTLPTRLFVNLSSSLVMPTGSVVCLILLAPVVIVFVLAGRVMRDDVLAAGMGKL